MKNKASEIVEPISFIERKKPFYVAGNSRRYDCHQPMDIPGQWEQFVSDKWGIPNIVGEAEYGVCIDVDRENNIQYLCAVEVSDLKGLPETFSSQEIPAGIFAVFSHPGHVSQIRYTVDSIWKKWLPFSNYKVPESSNFFLERYGENFDPEKGLNDIQIWIPVEKKQ